MVAATISQCLLPLIQVEQKLLPLARLAWWSPATTPVHRWSHLLLCGMILVVFLVVVAIFVATMDSYRD